MPGTPAEDYRRLNRAKWDARAPAHAASPGYRVQDFLDDPAFISDVVRFDQTLLGDVSGAHGVHLQCHIGTDTVSLARLGATMTGLDFSAASIAEARRIAAACEVDIDFVESDVYDAPSVLGGRAFDLVYTGVGALCWLPDIRRWGRVVADLLGPGGRLFVRDVHPALLALGDVRPRGVLALEESYVERAEPMVWEHAGTYVETDVVFVDNRSLGWNHGISEIVSALIDNGLSITGLTEHLSVPYSALSGHMEPIGGGEWQLIDRPWRLPATFTLQAEKGLPKRLPAARS